MKKQNELSHGENKERQSEGYSSKGRETTTAETHACHCQDRTKGSENTRIWISRQGGSLEFHP